MIFEYRKTVLPEWIDYNGHMQDAYYGLVFSKAVDALQDDVGFDQSYRQNGLYDLSCRRTQILFKRGS